MVYHYHINVMNVFNNRRNYLKTKLFFTTFLPLKFEKKLEYFQNLLVRKENRSFILAVKWFLVGSLFLCRAFFVIFFLLNIEISSLKFDSNVGYHTDELEVIKAEQFDAINKNKLMPQNHYLIYLIFRNELIDNRKSPSFFHETKKKHMTNIFVCVEMRVV